MNEQLQQAFLSGSRRALAKMITTVENDGLQAQAMLDKLYGRVGRAYRIGITGPPGAGKSTLVDQLTKTLRAEGASVGIIAVDPTSPFTGGALLGDRVRMTDLFLDDGVFIRSMATRGSLGGLSQKAQEAADLLDAFGKDYVIYETVGVGQSELDIVEAADTVIVELVPESGDSVQAMKAGLMEIASIFVMNKADRDGASRAVRELEAMLHLRPAAEWMPPVVPTIASLGKGVSEVRQKIGQHRAFLETGDRLAEKRKARLIKKVHELVSRRLKQEFWDDQAEKLLQENLANFQNRNLSPYHLTEQLMTNFRAALGEKLSKNKRRG